MIHRIMAAALVFGVLGGVSLAFAQHHAAAPGKLTHRAAAPEESASATCQSVVFRIYFEPGSSDLNRDAGAVIDFASHRVATCGSVRLELAANPAHVADARHRRQVSERSVSILTALRTRGVVGEVHVTPLRNMPLADRTGGSPDFVQIGVIATRTRRLISGAAHDTEISR